jgi:hypothetical protein
MKSSSSSDVLNNKNKILKERLVTTGELWGKEQEMSRDKTVKIFDFCSKAFIASWFSLE